MSCPVFIFRTGPIPGFSGYGHHTLARQDEPHYNHNGKDLRKGYPGDKKGGRTGPCPVILGTSDAMKNY